MSSCKGVEDRYQHGRGVALADFNGDGKTDIVYGNWNGQHRLFLQGSDSKFQVRKENGPAAEKELKNEVDKSKPDHAPLCRT